MQPQQRRALLSNALNLPPGRAVNRDTVIAALWCTIGWEANPQRVSRMLGVIDAYVDAKVRGAYSALGSLQPAPGYGDGVIRQQLKLIAMSVPQAGYSVSTMTPATAERPPVAAVPAPRSASLTVVPDPPPASPAEPAGSGDLLAASLAGEVAEETSLCTSCRRILPASQFWRNSRRASGIDYRCKDCKGQANKGTRQARLRRAEAEAAAEAAPGEKGTGEERK